MTTEGEGTAVPATPTDRHRELAAQLAARSVDAGDDVVELARWIAELLADEDRRRVPLEAVGAAFRRGMRTITRQAEQYAGRHAHATVTGVVGWLKAYEQATLDPGDRLDAFRAWLESDAWDHFRVDPDAALIALDAFLEAQR